MRETDPTTFLGPMVRCVRAASRVCRAVQATLSRGDSVHKDDRSPVTVADLATQAVVARRLADLYPGVPLVGEEESKVFDGADGAALAAAVLARVRQEWPDADEAAVRAAIDLGHDAGGADGLFFTLDPIDGTKGFLRGEQYAVALALVERGRVVAGVLGCPNLPREGGGRGALIAAARGAGSRVFAVEGDDLAGVATRASSQADPARLRLCESVEVGHSDRATSAAVMARLGVLAGPVRMDSQCKYGLIALGEGDLYLRSPTKAGRAEWIWDHAAGAVCVEEAGGRVTDLDGRPLDFGRGRTLSANRGIVATNGRLHDAVLAALAA